MALPVCEDTLDLLDVHSVLVPSLDLVHLLGHHAHHFQGFFGSPKTVFFVFLKKKHVVSEKCFSQSLQITSHIQLFIQKTRFRAFSTPRRDLRVRSSSPLSKSVDPIRLNLVPPKPDCPPNQQTEHIPSNSDGILVQLQTDEKTSVLFTCLTMFFFAVFKTFFFKLANPEKEIVALPMLSFPSESVQICEPNILEDL